MGDKGQAPKTRSSQNTKVRRNPVRMLAKQLAVHQWGFAREFPVARMMIIYFLRPHSHR